MELVSRLGYQVELNDGPGRDLIEQVHPDLLVIGSDWLRRDYLAQIDMTPDDFDRLELTLVYVPYTQGLSSTALKERLNG